MRHVAALRLSGREPTMSEPTPYEFPEVNDPLVRLDILKAWLREMETRMRVVEQWVHDRQQGHGG